MRDNFEFVELILYLTACGLLLPLTGIIGRESIWTSLLLLLLLIPVPAYAARLRFSLPTKIDLLLEKYAYVLFGVGLLFMAAISISRIVA